MNVVKTVGLPMWRVGMIAWKRRLEKRLINFIRKNIGTWSLTVPKRAFPGRSGAK